VSFFPYLAGFLSLPAKRRSPPFPGQSVDNPFVFLPPPTGIRIHFSRGWLITRRSSRKQCRTSFFFPLSFLPPPPLLYLKPTDIYPSTGGVSSTSPFPFPFTFKARKRRDAFLVEKIFSLFLCEGLFLRRNGRDFTPSPLGGLCPRSTHLFLEYLNLSPPETEAETFFFLPGAKESEGERCSPPPPSAQKIFPPTLFSFFDCSFSPAEGGAPTFFLFSSSSVGCCFFSLYPSGSANHPFCSPLFFSLFHEPPFSLHPWRRQFGDHALGSSDRTGQAVCSAFLFSFLTTPIFGRRPCFFFDPPPFPIRRTISITFSCPH